MGLAPVASGFNPQDPANVVNAQGYGLAWVYSDSLLQLVARLIHRGWLWSWRLLKPSRPYSITNDKFATSCTLLPPMR